jgi:hypothetical protein
LHNVIHVPEGYVLLEESIRRLMDITDRYHRLTVAAHPEQLSLDMERTWARVRALESGEAQWLIAFIEASHQTLLNTLRAAVAADAGGIAAMFVPEGAPHERR